MLLTLVRVSNLDGRVKKFPAEVVDDRALNFLVRFWDGKEAILDWLPKPGNGKIASRRYTEELIV